MPSALASFEAALDDLDVPVTRTDPASFGADLEAAIAEPAVGIPLDDVFEDPPVSLDDAPVEVDPTPVALRAATTGVTGARLGIAEYGSVALSPADGAGELVSLFVDRHVAVVREADLVPDLGAALDEIGSDAAAARDGAVLATGPSATADMGALVRGAHGPGEVRVVVLRDGDGGGS